MNAMKMISRIFGFLAVLLLLPTLALAITLGQIDTFEAPPGTLQNWITGNPFEPLQPVNAAGGPAGPDDHFLLLTADGLAGGGGRLVVINQSQWVGNYPAAGVNVITMSVNNLSTTNLFLRIRVADDTAQAPFNSAVSKVPVLLPANSGWTSVVFPVGPASLTALTGSVQTALTDARDFRLFHNPNPTFPPPRVAAQLGVDNIHAEHRDLLAYLPLLLLDD